MKIKFNSWYLLVFVFSLFFTPAFADNAEATVAIAYHIERTNGFLVEPGNNPYEILRRLGREINKSYPVEAKETYGASLLELDKLGGKEFLKPMAEDKLSSTQIEEAKKILANLEEEFSKFAPISNDEGAIKLKVAFNTKELLTKLENAKKNPSKTLSKQQLRQINDNFIPFMEISDYFIGILSISNDGIYFDSKVVSKDGKLPFKKNGLTIGKYFNNSALITLAQNRGIQDVDDLYENISGLPQLSFFKSALESAEIDLKKDVLGNLSTESLMSINLSPTGEGGLPDFRFVSPLPKIKEVKALLPKIKQLCIQTGFLNQYFEKPYDFVRTSFTMIPQFAIYSGFLDDLLIITTGEKLFIEEASRLEKVKKASKSNKANSSASVEEYDRYFRVNFEDFNMQLQQLLQSPLLLNKGIPPIPNLKFFDHMTELVGHFQLSASEGLIKIKMPLKKLK